MYFNHLLALAAHYAVQSLCNGRASVRPSVRPSVLLQPGRGQQISIDSCRRRILAIDRQLQASELRLRVASC